MSRLFGKPTICIGENKDADQLRGNREADHAFVFATRMVQFLFYLNPKFQASSSFLYLYRSVCVGPVRKPHCWFSHEAAQILKRNVTIPVHPRFIIITVGCKGVYNSQTIFIMRFSETNPTNNLHPNTQLHCQIQDSLSS